MVARLPMTAKGAVLLACSCPSSATEKHSGQRILQGMQDQYACRHVLLGDTWLGKACRGLVLTTDCSWDVSASGGLCLPDLLRRIRCPYWTWLQQQQTLMFSMRLAVGQVKVQLKQGAPTRLQVGNHTRFFRCQLIGCLLLSASQLLHMPKTFTILLTVVHT